MSLFQRSPYGGDPVFGSLFRFLDDFDSYSRGSLGNTSQAKGHGRNVRQQSFSPRFDIRETEETYELDGELPGIDRKDIVIEFTEPQTLVVRGRTEHTYSSGTPPMGLIGDTQTGGIITEGGEEISQVEDKSDTKKPNDDTAEDKSQRKERFWHQERSVGEFHRAFTFPSSVDNSGVSAKLNNGVLHITIPKAVNHSNHRITVN